MSAVVAVAVAVGAAAPVAMWIGLVLSDPSAPKTTRSPAAGAGLTDMVSCCAASIAAKVGGPPPGKRQCAR
jgi:hypothetical protein